MTMCLKEERECLFKTVFSNTFFVLMHFADKKVTIYHPYIILAFEIGKRPLQECHL